MQKASRKDRLRRRQDLAAAALSSWFAFLQMVFAIRQDRLGFLLIDQIKSKVGGNIAEREGHQGSLLQAVIHTFGVAIRNVVRQCNLDDPIRLSSLQLFTPKLQADERSQMKQIGVRDEFADGRPNGSASAASAIANLIS